MIELVAAMGILAFALLGLVGLQLHAMRDASSGNEQSRAATIARDVMEQMHRMPWNSVPVTAGGDWVDIDFDAAVGAGDGFELPGESAAFGLAADQIGMVVSRPAGANPVPTVANVFSVDWRVQAGVLNFMRDVDVRVQWTDPNGFQRTLVLSAVKYQRI